MQPHEREEMLQALASSRDALIEALTGVPEEIAARSPGADRWSILQCVEHVAVAEDYLLGQISIAAPAGESMTIQREAAIRARAADRTRPIPAPAEGQPTGRFPTLAQAIGHFLKTCARTIEFVESCTTDLRSQVTGHPILGKVNCLETLLVIAAHPKRHAEQIAEIRATLEIGGRLGTKN